MDTAEFNLKECQDQLRELYLGPEMKVQLTPWDPEHSVEMDAIFVNLELEEEEVSPSETKRIPLKRNEDLVTLHTTKGLRVNRILIQGEAGSGKSTLLDNIAYEWASQLENTNSPFSQFDLVFIIGLHKIGDERDSLEEIIFNQILEKRPNVSQSGLKSYLELNSQKCLFLIDELDGDNAGIVKSTTAEMSHLLYNKKYRNSCVIASTRPDILNDLGHSLSLFKKVHLTGFSNENIK